VKATVDETCIACGLCPDICPEVFELPEDAAIAKVKVDEVPAEAEATCREAAESCPVEAIHIEE
jgi:ferredoxin